MYSKDEKSDGKSDENNGKTDKKIRRINIFLYNAFLHSLNSYTDTMNLIIEIRIFILTSYGYSVYPLGVIILFPLLIVREFPITTVVLISTQSSALRFPKVVTFTT